MSAEYNEKGFYLATRSGNGLTFLDETGSRHFFSPNVSNKDLGFSALDCLSKSRLISPQVFDDTYDWREAKRQRIEYDRWKMAIGGFKTLKSMRRYLMVCSICVQDSMIYITHLHHCAIDAWEWPEDRLETEIEIPHNSAPAIVGAAVREGLKKCTGIGREDLIFPEPLPD
jgi:hypothetical protein